LLRGRIECGTCVGENRSSARNGQKTPQKPEMCHPRGTSAGAELREDGVQRPSQSVPSSPNQQHGRAARVPGRWPLNRRGLLAEDGSVEIEASRSPSRNALRPRSRIPTPDGASRTRSTLPRPLEPGADGLTLTSDFQGHTLVARAVIV